MPAYPISHADMRRAMPASGIQIVLMWCPLSAQSIVLRSCYAMSGTEAAYGATPQVIRCYAEDVSRLVDVCRQVCLAISLRAGYAMSGTEVGVWWYQSIIFESVNELALCLQV
eukprot:1665083-Rhodomonas_salina.1